MLIADIQSLEPGGHLLLFEIDGTQFGADIYRFHGYKIPYSENEMTAFFEPPMAGSQTWLAGNDTVLAGRGGLVVDAITPRPIYWQGNEYDAWPMRIDGIGSNSNSAPTRPTLSLGNVEGFVSALCLQFDDMGQAKVTIHETLSQYLDAHNFIDLENPSADPTQESIETWYIDAKTQEDDETVVFELSNPADTAGILIPARQLSAYCEWCFRGEYRGADCGYAGAAMFDDNDNPTTDPALDQCSGTLTGCGLRWGANNELPYGGAPAVNLMRS